MLVTGGAGFIGSHAVEALLAGGERVRVLDDFSTGKHENLSSVSGALETGALEVVEGDVRAAGACAAATRGCDRVLHLAAVASVTRSFDDPAETDAVNVGGTANVLTAAREAGVRRVAFASSCAIYGSTDDLPAREGARPHPESPYAASKLRAEELCREACRDGTLDVGVLRFFNVYGPRQDPSSEYSGVIAIFIDRVAAGRPCTVYGDGSQTRDFVYVADVVTACRAVLDGGRPDAGGARLAAAPVNVGTGLETSLLDVLAALAEASGRRPAVEFAAARADDIGRSRAACERAADLLAFTSSTPFAEGLATTWAWYLAGTRSR